VVFLGVGVATSFDGNPPLVAMPGQGVLIRKDAKPAIEPMGRCLADVMRRVEEQDPNWSPSRPMTSTASSTGTPRNTGRR
jgi:hypothetical protein